MAHSPKSQKASWADVFAEFANKVAWAALSPLSFCLALFFLIAWAVTGPFFGYSDGWQLLVNTGTTIITFLMVFIIQNSQNRDSLAVQIKLDEIIRAVSGAKNSMIDLECLSDQELAELRTKFAEIADEARTDEGRVERQEKRLNGHKGKRRSARKGGSLSAQRG